MLRILALVAVVNAAPARQLSDAGSGPTDGPNAAAVSAGSCYDMTTHVVTCNVPEDSCNGGPLGGYWYAPGYASSRSNCCHCRASCESTDESCSYYDDAATSGGSCYDMTTHVVTCNLAEADCSTGYWYAPGYVSSHSSCCHCRASCAIAATTACSYYDDPVAEETMEMTASFVVSGSPESFSDDDRTLITGVIATAAGVDASAVSLVFVAASTRITATVTCTADSASGITAADAAETAITAMGESIFSSPEAFVAATTAAGVTATVVIESDLTVTVGGEEIDIHGGGGKKKKKSSSAGMPTGALIGIIVGALAVVIIGVVVFMKSRPSGGKQGA